MSPAQKRRVKAGYRFQGEQHLEPINNLTFNKENGRMEVDYSFDESFAGKTIEVVFYIDAPETGFVTVMEFDQLRQKQGYYRDAKGNIIYDEHTVKNPENGEYLGRTYEEGTTYYSLFGEVVDLTTLDGKLYKCIDKAIMAYAEAYNPADEYSTGQPNPVDFNLGYKFNSGILSTASDNLHEFKYHGGYGYYHVYGMKDAMYGILNRGKGIYNKNSNFGYPLRNGYNLYIYNSKSRNNITSKNDFKIITVVFPTKELYQKHDDAIGFAFYNKNNPSPRRLVVNKKIKM